MLINNYGLDFFRLLFSLNLFSSSFQILTVCFSSILISICFQSQETKQDKFHAWCLLRLGGKEGGGGRTQKYQLRYNSITASIEREENGETFAWGCSIFTIHQPPPPAAYYKGWIKIFGPALDVIIKTRLWGIPYISNQLFDPPFWSDLLLWFIMNEGAMERRERKRY